MITGFSRANQQDLLCKVPFSDFLLTMKDLALSQGISLETVASALSHTKYLASVIKLDRNQKAFRVSFKDFSDKAVNKYRLLNGKKNIKKNQILFNKVWKKYGIPPEVIVSFWAMETDYGVVQGNFHTLSALGTLANDCRRSEFFQSQYLAAIKLVENKTLDAEKSVGAWAGEFGQIQMMPLDIISFGTDGDGDGKVQLDKSPHDTILTAAELIASKGWAPRQPWFEEVTLMKGFPWHEAGLGRARSIWEWSKLGVTPRNGNFSDIDSELKTTLILPQGRKGPKFLAYPNFNIFMQWNDSFMYSTTAAYLANRLRGESRYRSRDPDDILSFGQMVKLQEILEALGYDVGKVDGILGAKTRQSVRKIQLKLGFAADSWPTDELLDLLESI